MATVYEINRGINRPIEFKGFKSQYIFFLAGGLMFLLILFAILYVCHVSLYICLPVVFIAGAALFFQVKRLSDKYGEHGLLKQGAARRLPSSVQSRTRRPFLQLKSGTLEKA